MIKGDFKFVKNRIILVQVTELRLHCIMHWNNLDRLGLHMSVPNLDTQVITGDKVTAILAEPGIGDRPDNVREEAIVTGIYIGKVYKGIYVSMKIRITMIYAWSSGHRGRIDACHQDEPSQDSCCT